MKRVYLVDSENVGDVWVPLLAASLPEEEVVVFYTQQSPHMGYENVRLLKETDKIPVFIKCFEGRNALDFQLVTELGYKICADEECEYIIISTDAGFDAAVRYWSSQNKNVRRVNGKECFRQATNRLRRHEAGNTQMFEEEIPDNAAMGIADDVAEETESFVSDEQTAAEPLLTPDTAVDLDLEQMKEEEAEVISSQEDLAAEFPKEQPEKTKTGARRRRRRETTPVLAEKVETADNTERIVTGLFGCIKKDNLADFHNAMVMFLGEDDGKRLYQEAKNSLECNAFWAEQASNTQQERFDIYCKMLFECNAPEEKYPEDIADFLCKSDEKRKNLNSLRAALQSQYGKDKGMKYYSLFKSHIKIMNRM